MIRGRKASSSVGDRCTSGPQDTLEMNDVQVHTTTDHGKDPMHCESEYSFPGDHRFDESDREAACLRSMTAQKQANLDSKYSDYRDVSPCFIEDKRTLQIPAHLDRLDRITITSQMDDMRRRENTALQSARLYRDRCTELKQHIRKLETEKEAVRYFWRNKVLEGQSRAGKIVKLSIDNRLLCDKCM